jgi:hypothetical protein
MSYTNFLHNKIFLKNENDEIQLQFNLKLTVKVCWTNTNQKFKFVYNVLLPIPRTKSWDTTCEQT